MLSCRQLLPRSEVDIMPHKKDYVWPGATGSMNTCLQLHGGPHAVAACSGRGWQR